VFCLWLASRAVDDGFSYFGLALVMFGVASVFVRIHRATRRRDA
jgi:hypothetical protein